MQTKCAHCDLELTTDQKDGRFGTSPKERAERSKKLEEERTNLTKTLEAHPEAAELCYWRGRIQEALGRSDEAIVDYSRAVERDPLHGEARYRRTIADYWKLSANLDTAWELPSDFFERTQKDLEALDDFPTRRERAILLKGLLRFSRSLWEAGHDPTFWPASPVERFKAIYQAFDEALADSLRENPTFFDALLLRGFFNALNRMNRSFDSSAYGRERETSAKRAATIEPNDSRCYEALASIHASMEDWGAALADTDEMVELCPGGLKGLLLRARLLWRMGLRPPALQAIDAAIQANPQSPDPYSVRASLRLSDWIQQRNESSCHDGAAPIERDLDAAVAREKRAGAARLVRAFARRAFFEDESGTGNDYQAWEGENRNHPWVRSGYFQKWKEERGSVGFLPEGLDLYPQADPERVRQGCVDHAKRLCDKPAADRAALLPTIAALVDRALELGELP